MKSEGVPIPLHGLPGTWVSIVGRNGSPIPEGPAGYRTTFYLGIPGLEAMRSASDGSSVELLTDSSGDSPIHFREMAPNSFHSLAVGPKRDGEALKIDLRVNEHSRLSSATAYIEDASGSLDAIQRASAVFCPLLNWFAYKLDVGVTIEAIIVARDDDLSRQLIFYRPFDTIESTLAECLEVDLPDPLVPFLSLYREALSSTNHFYQFIVFGRILEGLTGFIPSEIHTLKPAGLLDDVFPDTDRIPSEYRGKKLQPFLDMVIGNYRNAVAHFLHKKTQLIQIPDMIENILSSSAAMAPLRYAIKVKLENARLKIVEDYRQAGEQPRDPAGVRIPTP